MTLDMVVRRWPVVLTIRRLSLEVREQWRLRAADVQQRQSAALEVSYPSRTLQNQSRARVNGLCLLILSVTRQ